MTTEGTPAAPAPAPPPPTAPLARPPSLPFPLQEGESVLALCRRHWLYLWPNIILKSLVALAPLIAIAAALAAADAYEGVAAKVFWVVSAVWLLFWGVRIFLAWYRYHHDIWVITNQRLIDSYKSNPFSLRVATADLV